MDFSDDCRELSLVSLNKEIGYRMSMKMRKANVSDFQQQPTHPFETLLKNCFCIQYIVA